MLQAKGETIHRITAVPTDDQSTLEDKTATDKVSINESKVTNI